MASIRQSRVDEPPSADSGQKRLACRGQLARSARQETRGRVPRSRATRHYVTIHSSAPFTVATTTSKSPSAQAKPRSSAVLPDPGVKLQRAKTIRSGKQLPRVRAGIVAIRRQYGRVKLAGIGAKGFRNLSGFIPLYPGLAVAVGENNAGKSNLIDACRLLFEPEVGPAARLWITKGDFAHDGHGNRTTDTFELEAVFTELASAERARMVTCLSPSRGPSSARIRLRATLTSSGRVHTEWFGGDSDHPDIEQYAREAVSFTYLHPLRDAASDLRPGRSNRLGELVGALAPEGHPDRSQIEKIMSDANSSLSEVESVGIAQTRVQTRLSELTGGGRLSQSSDLVFAEPRFDRVITALRARVGSIGPVEITESGLGYSNMQYMSVLLSALEEPSDAALRLLLIEEPEAHLHPQLQDLLMRFLETASAADSQVVVTTHSPNLASGAKVERLTVLSRSDGGAELFARCIGEFGLDTGHLKHLRRFLDVTKSALLFSRGVILVEGLAEQLLLPAMADRLGRSLSEAGVCVVNVDGLAFRPFIELFGPDRLPIPCAVISDSDPQEVDPVPSEVDANVSDLPPTEETALAESAGDDLSEEEAVAAELSATAKSLVALGGDHLGVFLAEKTFEWDLVKAGNWEVVLEAFKHVKPRVSGWLKRDYVTSSWAERADAFLAKVEDEKGRFAQELAAEIDPPVAFTVPKHVEDAIFWATSKQVITSSERAESDAASLQTATADDTTV